MTKIVIMILLMNSISSTQAQTIQNLDIKNGYNEYKIGDSFEKWKGVVHFENTESNGAKNFTVMGSLPQLFNKYAIHEIYLKFVNEKVSEINIILKKWDGEKLGLTRQQNLRNSTENFTDIGLRFNALFGEATKTFGPEHKSSNNDILWTTNAIWSAKKITLIESIQFLEIINVSAISVKIADNRLMVKEYTEGF